MAKEMNEPVSNGSCYEAVVPDTLDLAEKAGLGLGFFLRMIDEKHNFEIPLFVEFDDGRVKLGWHMNSLGGCQPKCMEAMCFERLMTGSQEGLEIEASMLDMMVSLVGEDGLMWVPGDKMPWSNIQEPFAMMHGQGRMLRAMIAWYQYTGDPRYKDAIDRMVDGLDRIAVHTEDYAYFPIYGWHEGEYTRSCYTKKGWKDTSEPTHEKHGEEGSLFNHQGHIPGALATWHAMTGNEKAIRLAGELVRFLTKPKFWADWKGGDYPKVTGAEHAHWHGHPHGHMNVLRAILDYAVATNDTRLMQFVRDGYEWARQPHLSRIGVFGDWQGCGIGRLIGVAVKLSLYGVGDYWEDVDLYVRNMGVQMQVRPDCVPFLREHTKGRCDTQGPYTAEAWVDIEETVGGYFAMRGPDSPVWQCCSPHGNMGLFYAWDGALRHSEGVVTINLLLNRASAWMDVDSFIPYEGKVVLRNKSAKEAFVRVPLYVRLNDVSCRVGVREVKPEFFGRYLVLRDLKPGDEVTVSFPLSECKETWTDEGITHTITLRGNTVVDFDPPFGKPGDAVQGLIFQDLDKYRQPNTPMKKTTRFAPAKTIKW